jgi:HPt (histidine-containing phosphotransfer) domain-containing protein
MARPLDSRTQELETMLQTLWQSNYGILLERIRVLRKAQQRLATGSLDNLTRKDAEAAAHKLAGVLGSFGLPQGSALASRIETALAQEPLLNVERVQELKAWLDELEAVIESRPRTFQP